MLYLIIFVLVLLLFFASFYWVYKSIKPYLKSRDGRKSLLMWFSILFLISTSGYLLISHLMKGPKYFEQGISQLHGSKFVKDRINDFNAYTYYSEKLPKETDNPAIFQVELHGDSLNLYVTCTMKREGEQWKLINIRQDSLLKGKQE